MMTDEDFKFQQQRDARQEMMNLCPLNKINMTRDAAWVALQAANALCTLVMALDCGSVLPTLTAFTAKRARDDLRDLWKSLSDAGMEN